MPEQERPVIFRGGPTKAGREGRIAETKWLHDFKRANEARSRLFDGLRELARFRTQLEEEVKQVQGDPDVLQRYLTEVERRKNAVREEHEQLRQVASENPSLATELAILDQYVTPEVKHLVDEINALIGRAEEAKREKVEEAQQGGQEVEIDTQRLLSALRNAPPPPPPPPKREPDAEVAQPSPVPAPPPLPGSETVQERRTEEGAKPEMSPGDYEQAVRGVILNASTLLEFLRSEEGKDPAAREKLREEPDRLEQELKELDERAGHPKPKLDIREDADNLVDGIRLLLEEPPAPPAAAAAVARRRVPKGSSFVAWMPRVPAPPYVRTAKATLASAPPPPPPATDAAPAEPAEGEQLAKLEAALREFNEEKERLLARHAAVVDQVQQRIRERKLQALRDTLNTPA